jgi:hypothetical protein
MEIMDNAPTLEDAVNECVALKTKIKELEAEKKKLREVIENGIDEIRGIVELMENDGELEYSNLIEEIEHKLQKAIEGEE